MYQKLIAQMRNTYHDITAKDGEKIKDCVQLLLKDIHMDNRERYPLPVVQLLRQVGFDLFRTEFQNPQQSGLIAVDSALGEQNTLFASGRIILVNRNDSTAHQRFTIAHELAHYIFDYDEQNQLIYYKPYLTSETDDDVELRANRFAAELLMPTDDFKRYFYDLKSEQGDAFSLPNTVTELSRIFDAPPTAVQKRLYETGILPQQEAVENA